jgi:hypothetical protein
MAHLYARPGDRRVFGSGVIAFTLAAKGDRLKMSVIEP